MLVAALVAVLQGHAANAEEPVADGQPVAEGKVAEEETAAEKVAEEGVAEEEVAEEASSLPPPDAAPEEDPHRAEELAIALAAAADSHHLEDVGLQFLMVEPGTPIYERWAFAFRPFGPLETTLAGSRGVLQVAAVGPQTRIVLDTLPRLSLLMAPSATGLRLVAIEPTTCDRCSEPERFVRDLVADVQRRGSLGDRLQLDVELISRAISDAAKWDAWAAAAEGRNQANQALARDLAGITLASVEGDVVTVRWPNGAVEPWTIRMTPRGPAIDVDLLSETSPLRLSSGDAKRFRKSEERQSEATATWEPMWRPVARGAATWLGDHVLAGGFDPLDDHVALVAWNEDIPWAAVLQVDPETRGLGSRVTIALPEDLSPTRIFSGPGAPRAAFDPWLRSAVVSLRGRLFAVPFDQGISKNISQTSGIGAVGFDAAAQPVWIDGDGVLHTADGAETLAVGAAVGVHVAETGGEAVRADGTLVRWSTEGELSEPIALCERDEGSTTPAATAATRHPIEGSWLVVCGPQTGTAFARWDAPTGVVHRVPGRIGNGRAVAWSPDGRWFAVPADDDLEAGVVVWDTEADAPALLLGERTSVNAAFSAHGHRLLTVDIDGRALVWDLDLAFRHHAVAGARR